MTIYATAAELEDYLGGSVPPDADRLLQRASELLDTYIDSYFEVDTLTGLPRETTKVAELSKAACAQVEYWMQTGDEADVLTGRTFVNIPGAFSTSGQGRRLAPRAADALRRGGLIGAAVAS